MLTKNDLKAIRTTVQEQVDDSLVRELTPIKKDIRVIKRDMTRVRKDIKYMSGQFDEEIVHTRRRVERIEEHLHLESPKN